MPQHRTRHSAEFKAKVAVAALSESKTLAELSSEYGINAAQLPVGSRSWLGEPPTSLVKGRRRRSTMRQKWRTYTA